MPTPVFAVERLGSPDTVVDPTRIAVVDGEVGLDYTQLDESVRRVANGLRSLGVDRADRVAFVGRNCLAAVQVQLATARIAATATLLNWRLSPTELSYVLADCSARVAVVTQEFLPVFEALPDRGSVDTVLVVGDDDSSWSTWSAAQSSEPIESTAHDDDVVLQLYTSGTTGRPKGAMLTRTSLRECIPDTAAVWALDPSSVVLSVLPMFHIAGAGTALASLLAGAQLVISNDPSPSGMLATIERHGVTNLIVASLMLQGLIESPDAEHTDLSSIRTVSYGAAPISGAVLQHAIDRLGCRIVQAYGLTETAGILAILDDDDHARSATDPLALERLRSCGRGRPGVDLRIVDIQTGEALPPGEPGEVQARTGRLMSGYWNRPDETAEVLLPGGWFRTGDVGVLDADGYLFLRDRLKDTIISGGENVYPAEVEDALQWHPDVARVAIIGVPDDRWGETPLAVVVRAAGSSPTEAELIAFARDRIAHYKCPTRVVFADDLPVNATGKVLRRELREPYWAGRDRRIN